MLFDTVEQRGDGKYLPLIDALRQVVRLCYPIECEAGLIDFDGFPHPLRGNDTRGIRLSFFFVGDRRKPGQAGLISSLVRIIAVTIGSRQIGQQSGKQQGQHQQNPSEP